PGPEYCHARLCDGCCRSARSGRCDESAEGCGQRQSSIRAVAEILSDRGCGVRHGAGKRAADQADAPARPGAQLRQSCRRGPLSWGHVRLDGTVERQLQFRPQPVYRFDKPTAERDGAVFVGFEDWDPELLTLIETRATPNGPRWHAGFARFTN